MNLKKILSTAVVLSGTWLSGMAQYQGDPTLFGYQYNVMVNAFGTGLFQVPTTGAEPDMLWEDSFAYQGEYATGREMTTGWIRNGQLCGYVAYYPMPNQSYYKYVERDLKTGVVSKEMDVDISSGWTNYFLNAAYCPADDRIYGYGFNESRTGFAFKSAPASNPNQAVIIREVGSTYPGSICFNPELGVFVGVLNQRDGYTYTNSLVTIDVNTGQTSHLYNINTDEVSDYKCTGGLIWVPARQAYVWNFYNAGQEGALCSQLVELNPVYNKSTKVCDFDENINFMYFVAENNEIKAAADAPQQVTGVQMNAENRNVNLTFTLPAKLVNGTAISGTVNYTVYVDNVSVSTGSGNAGAAVNTNLTINDGSHFVRIVPTVNGKNGIGEVYSIFIGEGTPQTPENIVLTETELTWSPVLQGIVGNTLKDVSYTVYVNDKKITETTETKVSMSGIILPDGELTAYQAMIQAVAQGHSSKTGYSNHIIAGKPWTVPFTVVPTDEQYKLMVQEDVDKDNVTWSLDYDSDNGLNVLTSGFSRNDASDDWIFLPKFTADANKVYSFSCDVYLADASLPGGVFEAWIGDAPSKSAMKNVIIPNIRINWDNNRETYYGEFVANGDLAGKDLYIGIGVTSEKGVLSPLRIYELKVEESTQASINGPEAVGNLNVNRDENDAKVACLSFTMPSKTLAGTEIPASATITVDITMPGATSVTVTGKPGEAVNAQMTTGSINRLITLTPSYNGVKGLSKNCVSSLGLSVPGMVRNLRASYDWSNTALRLDWDAPATDVNGTSMEGDKISYSIWVKNEDTGDYEFAVNIPYPLQYATMNMTEITTLTNVEVAVTASNGMGDSPEVAKILCQVGTPLTLPIDDDFNGDQFKYGPITTYVGSPYNKAAINWGDPKKGYWGLSDDMMSIVGDVLCGVPVESGSISRIDLPKVSTLNSTEVSLQLNIWTGIDAATTTVRGTYPSEETLEWDDIEFYPAVEKEVSIVPAGNGYQLVTVNFPDEFLDQPWINAIIESEYPTMSSRFILAGYALTSTTGLNKVEETLYGTICGGEGVINITGYDGETAYVYSLDGAKVASAKVAGNVCTIPVGRGFYLVKVANRNAKVVVR